MAKSLQNNSHKEKKMEFKINDDIKVIDETKASVFGDKQVTTSTTDSVKIELTKGTPNKLSSNWIDAYSDCA